MPRDGYIIISRRLFESSMWTTRREFSMAEAWIDLIQSVRYGEGEDDALVGTQIIKVGRGQTIKAVRTWARSWGWSKSKVARVFQLWEKWEQIRYERVGKVGRITICNYDRYQRPWDSDGTIVGQSWDNGGTMVGQEEYSNAGNEGNTPTQYGGVASGKPSPAADIIEIPLKDGTMYPVNEEAIAKAQSTYSTLDVRQQLKMCAAWNEANQDKRKTTRGIRKHINGWLSKAFQDQQKTNDREPHRRMTTPEEAEANRINLENYGKPDPEATIDIETLVKQVQQTEIR